MSLIKKRHALLMAGSILPLVMSVPVHANPAATAAASATGIVQLAANDDDNDRPHRRRHADDESNAKAKAKAETKSEAKSKAQDARDAKRDAASHHREDAAARHHKDAAASPATERTKAAETKANAKSTDKADATEHHGRDRAERVRHGHDDSKAAATPAARPDSRPDARHADRDRHDAGGSHAERAHDADHRGHSATDTSTDRSKNAVRERDTGTSERRSGTDERHGPDRNRAADTNRDNDRNADRDHNRSAGHDRDRGGDQNNDRADNRRSPAELQLEAQGKSREAKRLDELSRKLDAQERRLNRNDRRDAYERRADERAERVGDRVIIRRGDTVYVRPDRDREGMRLLYGARDVNVRHVDGNRVETTVIRDDGSRIVTVRDRYGDVVRRERIVPGGRRYVLIDDRPVHGNVAYQVVDLPPLREDIRRRPDYVVELNNASEHQINQVLLAPPVVKLPETYSLRQVRDSVSLRNRMPRIDVDVTFPTGSAAIPPDQVNQLSRLGQAMAAVLKRNPDEVFLVEGFTDAVGAADANLVLSDQRAEAVATALSDSFGIAPENLVTQGYGEQFLKVDTSGAERANRRVTIQRITPLIRSASAK